MGMSAGDEDGDHPIAFEPFAEFGAAAFGCRFVHEAASAAMGGLEEDDVTDRGTRDGETCAKPGDGRAFDRDQNKQRVENTSDRDAGRIEN